MSTRNYPPPEIIFHPMEEKRNYEHIILWMLYNNEECEWSDFCEKPLEIPTSTLSRYLKTLKIEGYINKISKGHYKITSGGKRRFHFISMDKEKRRKLSFPPETILNTRNYDHWILWTVYNNNYCKWSDFLEEPLSINQSSLSKTIKLLIKSGFIIKDEDSKEYRITHLGKSQYSKLLKDYDLDRQTILEEESRRIEDLTKKTLTFFDKYNIKDEKLQFRFLSNNLKLDYNRVNAMLKNEEDFLKILLFLSINHPSQYPNYVSSKEFSKNYGIKENTLTYYIDEIVENNIYPIKFFGLRVPPDKVYYFQENEKVETVLRAITEEHLTELTYLNKLFSRSINPHVVIKEILEEICKVVFNQGLKDSLREFLPEYIDYLAYKIETKRELKETYDKLEGIIWQNISYVFQPKNSKNIESQYEQELKEINKEIDLNPQNIDLYYLKIRIMIHLGQYNEIFDLLDDIIKIFPENKRDIQIKKASILKRINEIEAGLKIIDELLKKNPRDKELLVYKAYWLQYLNKNEESLQIIRNLIKLNPDNWIYLDTYGEILMSSEEYQKALEQFQKVIEITADEWYIYQTYIKLGICHK
ncbi:MAG: tetratricopeptide repeat protein, partial [Promethearchaeota archaeon]